MKKIIFLILLLNSLLSANSDSITVKIYENIISNFTDKPIIYTNDPIVKNIISKYSKKLSISNNKSKANIYILSHKEDDKIDSKKFVFVTKYSLLKNLKYSLGAFYWKKGRPNIIFIKERIEKKEIKLNKKYNNYIENERCLYELCF